MIRCELCNSNDIVRAKVKKNEVIIAICKECGSIYEVDEKLMPVFGHDTHDIVYFKSLQALFETWNDVSNVVPYNEKRR